MCTVTFVPLNDKVFITHNRDEKSSRSIAMPPAKYTVNGYTLLFPRDTAAGGTWIAINNNGAAAVLLNGAFTNHVQQLPYRKSRGLVLLDIVAAADPQLSFEKTDLNGIEPFTIVLWQQQQLFECRWDGMHKHVNRLPANLPHTWSSATLYNQAVLNKRKTWFQQWQQTHTMPTMEDIVQHHMNAGDGDAHNDLRMNRQGQMLTVSITSMELSEDKSMMQYTDLCNNTRTLQEFNFTKAGTLQ